MPSPSPPPLPPRVSQPRRPAPIPSRPSQPIPVPVSLPNHPPYSVSPRPSYIHLGSGPVTPVGTPSSVIACPLASQLVQDTIAQPSLVTEETPVPVSSSVISCPLASQHVKHSGAQSNNLPSETQASSLDWDNYQSSPELLGRKILIVSTQCSSLEPLDFRLEEVNEHSSDSSLFNSAENYTVMEDKELCK